MNLLCPFDLFFVARTIVGAQVELLVHRSSHVRVVVSKNQRAMTDGVIDEFVIVDIPFVGAIGFRDRKREGVHESAVMCDPTRQALAGTFVHRFRSGEMRLVITQ